MIPTVNDAKEFLTGKLAGFQPNVALITGSGLGGIAAALSQPLVISYSDIPHFPQPTVAGHAGQMFFGELAGKRLMILCGRFHYYEGRPSAEVVHPVHVIKALGVQMLILTNAAGGIHPDFNPGDLMLITDHINFMGVNPLTGYRDHLFIDMSEAYSLRLRQKFEAAAAKSQVAIHRGVYLATAGPNYETPAEIKAFAHLGADAVGMSTVPEVIMARYHGIEVAGLSCITNSAAGISKQPLSHQEVLEVGQASQAKLVKLLTAFLDEI